MGKKSMGKRLLTGATCLGITTTMFASTVFASPVGKAQLSVLGSARAVSGNDNKTKNAENKVVAPLAAAAVISQVSQPSLTPIAAAAVDTKAIAQAEQAAAEAAAAEAAAAEAAAEAASPYANVAISQVQNYVNIRVEPNTEAEVVGKLYNNAAGTILETVEQEDGTWYKVESGSVTGYIKSDYFVTGTDAEAIAQDVGHVTATVNTETLRMRQEATTDSSIVELLPEGGTYDVEEQGEEFTKIVTDTGKEGYVHNDYIEVEVNFDQAISIEEERRQQEAAEEAARQEAAEEAARQEAAEEAARQEAEEETESSREESSQEESRHEESSQEESREEETQQETEAAQEEESQEDTSYSSNSELRSAIVDYATSFVGKLDYVYGGTSLTSGVDCSGFVQQIFAAYGISLPRTSGSQGSSGRQISYDEIQPGDLVHYSGHIAIYIGNGQVVHASSPSTGVKISTWNYRSVESIRNVID